MPDLDTLYEIRWQCPDCPQPVTIHARRDSDGTVLCHAAVTAHLRQHQ